MTIVGEAVVLIRGKDMLTTDLNKAIQPAMEKISGSVSSIGATIKDKIGAGIQSVATITAGTMTAVAGVTAGIVAQGVQYNVLMQKARAAFTTVLGSAKAADTMLRNIQEFAHTSPFPRQVFVEATQQMLGFGFAAKDVIPTLKSVQDAVAASGGSAEDIQQIVNALSNVQAQGKFGGEALQQLAGQGINAAEIIGEQMHLSGQQIKEQISAGALSAEDGIKALTAGMEQHFGGAAANLKGTWVGAVDSIKGATRDLGSALVAPFIDPKGGGYAVEWAGILADSIRTLTTKLQPIFDGLMKKMDPFFKRLTTLSENVDIGKVFDDIGDSVSKLAPIIAPLVASLGALGGANIAGMLGPLGAFLPTINPVFAAIVALIAVMPELQDAFKEIIPILMDAAKQLGDTFLPAIEDLMPLIHELADVIADALVQAFQDLVPPIMQILENLEPLLPVIGAIIDAFLTGLAPVLTVIIDVLAKLLEWLAKVPVVIPMVIGAVIALNLAMAANPVLLIVAGIVLLIGVLIKLWPKISIGVDKMKEFGRAITQHLVHAWDAVKRAFARVGGWFADTFRNLVQAGKRWMPVLLAIFVPFIGIPLLIRSHWSQITGFFGRLFEAVSSRVRAGVSNVATFFGSLPEKMVAGLGNLNALVVGAISRGLSNVKNAVVNAFSGAASWLINAGSSIISGLISGITSKIGELTSKLSGLKNTIKNAKGPPDVDAVLLEPAGQLIMGGLIRGIGRAVPDLQRTLGGVTDAIRQTGGRMTADVNANVRRGANERGSQAGVVVQFPKTLRLRIGDREFTAYVGEIADDRIDAADTLAWQGA
jgi:tape measure domain-containing protein